MKLERKIKPLYLRAATVAYVRCPTSQRLIEQPAGSALPLKLIIDAN
jgi:hypothetical protein